MFKKPLLRLHLNGFVFTPHLLPTLLTLLLLPGLISLGFWQLHRADYKKTLLVEYQMRGQGAVLSAQDLNKLPEQLQYYRIQLAGHFDNQHSILLDNKIHAKQVGYQVLTPLIIDGSSKIILINRGWIPRQMNRQLPEITAIKGKQTLVGTVWIPQKGFLLQAEQANHSHWPYLAQTIDLNYFSQLLERPLYPFILLLAPEAPGGFIREWNLVTVSPQKHYGYAFQWFALAAALLIIFIVVNCRRLNK